MEILKVENLTKTYGSGENLVHAVDDVSFSVEKGEFVAIVGASGSGKSTLLHLIGGVDRPTSGKIFESSKQIHEIMSELFAEKYEINSDLVEARSAAIVASIIFDEIMEGTD